MVPKRTPKRAKRAPKRAKPKLAKRVTKPKAKPKFAKRVTKPKPAANKKATNKPKARKLSPEERKIKYEKEKKMSNLTASERRVRLRQLSPVQILK